MTVTRNVPINSAEYEPNDKTLLMTRVHTKRESESLTFRSPFFQSLQIVYIILHCFLYLELAHNRRLLSWFHFSTIKIKRLD